MVPNVLIEEEMDLLIKELVEDQQFEKSDREIETYEKLEELNDPRIMIQIFQLFLS